MRKPIWSPRHMAAVTKVDYRSGSISPAVSVLVQSLRVLSLELIAGPLHQRPVAPFAVPSR